MAIQYSGTSTVVNTTFTPSTRADIVNNITSNLSTAGWTTISGTPGSGSDVTMETPLSNGNAKVRFRFFDPGSGNCAQITMKHSSGSPTSQICYCLPTNTWRIIANKYSFFAFKTGASNRVAARGCVMGGQLYTPAFLTINTNDAVSFMYGHGTSDADATARTSWRATLRPYNNANTEGVFSGMYGSTLFDGLALSSHLGAPGIVIFQGGYWTNDVCFRWEDNTLLAYEPILSWATGTSSSNEGKLKGQLYDSIVISGQWPGESVISYDNHTWLAITDQADLSESATSTLFVLVS